MIVREVATAYVAPTKMEPAVEMEELLRTNDPVLLSFAEALLKDAGIKAHIFDQNMSVLEGSIGVLTRRLLVHQEDTAEARKILGEAGMGTELVAPKAV